MIMKRALMAKQGQGLTEYGLIGAFIVVAAVAALSVMAGSLQNVFSSMVPGVPQRPQVAEAPESPGGTVSNPPVNAPVTGKPTMSVTLTSGAQISFEGYPEDLEVSLQTAGANGTSEKILANMELLAKQLLESGEITETQANALLALANQGHKIADVEKLIEDAAARPGLKAEELAKLQVTYDGKTQGIGMWSNEIGFGAMDSSPKSTEFQTLLDKARASGAMDDPVVDQVVSLMSEQILNIANAVESAKWTVEHTGLPPAMLQTAYAEGLAERYATGASSIPPDAALPASEVTHGNSTEICKSGNGADTGTYCTN